MTKKSIFEQDNYTQLFIYIFKNENVKATQITKDMKDYFTDRRNFSMMIQEMRKKKFLITKGYGKHAIYSINIIGVLYYWLDNYCPHRYNTLFKKYISTKSEEEREKIRKAWLIALFKHIIIYSESKTRIEIDKNIIKKDKELKNILELENGKYYHSMNHHSIKEAFEGLRDNLLFDGMIYFSERKELLPY